MQQSPFFVHEVTEDYVILGIVIWKDQVSSIARYPYLDSRMHLITVTRGPVHYLAVFDDQGRRIKGFHWPTDDGDDVPGGVWPLFVDAVCDFLVEQGICIEVTTMDPPSGAKILWSPWEHKWYAIVRFGDEEQLVEFDDAESADDVKARLVLIFGDSLDAEMRKVSDSLKGTWVIGEAK